VRALDLIIAVHGSHNGRTKRHRRVDSEPISALGSQAVSSQKKGDRITSRYFLAASASEARYSSHLSSHLRP
jgi:hypothetical protein